MHRVPAGGVVLCKGCEAYHIMVYMFLIPLSTGGAGISCNVYKLTSPLLALEAASPAYPSLPVPPPPGFPPLQEWERFLAAHPDQVFAAFMRRGLSAGFRIGADTSRPRLPASDNMPSVQAHPELVSDYIAHEVRNDKLALVTHWHSRHMCGATQSA